MSALGAGGAFVATVAESTGASVDNLWVQLGGVGACLAVGMWLIRRSDAIEARNDTAHAEEIRELRKELKATTDMLVQALKDNKESR